MNRAAQILFAAYLVVGAVAPHGQSSLTTTDYDDFYDRVILKAANGTKEEWLASYDPVVNFIARVRKDVETLPDATRQALAEAVHDNGYWKGQANRVRDARDPFVGSKLNAPDEWLRTVLTPEGYESYRNRYAQRSRGYQFTLEVVADRGRFLQAHGQRHSPAR